MDKYISNLIQLKISIAQKVIHRKFLKFKFVLGREVYV